MAGAVAAAGKMETPRHAFLLFRRSLRGGARSPIFAFLWPTAVPLAIVGFTSQVFKEMVRLPAFPVDQYIAWQAPGVVILTGMLGAGFSATSLVMDELSGYMDRLRLLAARPGAVLLGPLLFDAARVVPAASAVLVVSVALGARLDSGVPGGVAIVALTTLWTISYVGLFYAVSLRSRNAQAAMAIVPIFLPLMFLSTMFVPRDLMPGWIDVIAGWNPMTYVIEANRMFMTTSFSWSGLAQAVAACGVVLLVTQTLARGALRRLDAGAYE